MHTSTQTSSFFLVYTSEEADVGQQAYIPVTSERRMEGWFGRLVFSRCFPSKNIVEKQSVVRAEDFGLSCRQQVSRRDKFMKR